MNLKTLALGAVLMAATGTDALAKAGDQIGSAVRIVNRVTADFDKSQRNLSTGDGVKQDEVIAVEKDALGELKLNDDTKLALGPGARMTLDKFVYDPNQSGGTVAVNLLKGAFRFITGLSRKNSYSIKTPTAAITVRGTVFDIYVEDNGATWLLLHEGSLEVCNAQKVCRTLQKSCRLINISTGGNVGSPQTWGEVREPRAFDFATAFPFVVTAPSIDPTPLHARAQVEAGQCPDTHAPPLPRKAEYNPPVKAATATQTKIVENSPAKPKQEAPSKPPTSVAGTTVATTGLLGVGRGWTGFYIGGNAGGSWSGSTTGVNCNDPTGVFDGPGIPNCAASEAIGGLETSYQTDPSGFVGGVQTGYNFQTGNIVLGIEVDMDRTSISGDVTKTGISFQNSFGTRNVSQELAWLGTVRARAGYAVGNVLLFGTGGLAYGRANYHYDSFYTPGLAFSNITETTWKAGWTLGGGAEVGFGAWSLKGEYLYYDLGNENLSAQFFFAGGVPQPAFFEPDFETNGHILRLGVNYRLD